MASTLPKELLLQYQNGSSAYAWPSWVCAPIWFHAPTPPRVFSGLAQPCVLPFQPSNLCGGCLAGLPLAEAQVQACSWPHTPPSWADRKIPDIVVQRWLQAGRQQEVGAGEGGPEPPEHLRTSGPVRLYSWRATCLRECLWVSGFQGLVWGEEGPIVGLMRDTGEASLLAF